MRLCVCCECVAQAQIRRGTCVPLLQLGGGVEGCTVYHRQWRGRGASKAELRCVSMIWQALQGFLWHRRGSSFRLDGRGACFPNIVNIMS